MTVEGDAHIHIHFHGHWLGYSFTQETDSLDERRVFHVRTSKNQEDSSFWLDLRAYFSRYAWINIMFFFNIEPHK